MEDNKLNGLQLNGFINNTTAFDAAIFEDNKNIEQLRILINKYFNKTEVINKEYSSYILKTIVEKFLGTPVANGELIYAMHLEGFHLAVRGSNCRFNISSASIRHLENSKYTLSLLETAPRFNITEALASKKSLGRFKYHFKLLIELVFERKSKLKNDAIAIIAKEINEDTKTVNDWMNILASEGDTIPPEHLQTLASLFKLSPSQLLNTVKMA